MLTNNLMLDLSTTFKEKKSNLKIFFLLAFISGIFSNPTLINNLFTHFINIQMINSTLFINTLVINLIALFYNTMLFLIGYSMVYNTKVIRAKLKEYLIYTSLYSLVFMSLFILITFIISSIELLYLPTTSIYCKGISILITIIAISTSLLYFSAINIQYNKTILNTKGYFKNFKSIILVFKPIKKFNIKILTISFFVSFLTLFLILTTFFIYKINIITNGQLSIYFLLFFIGIKTILSIINFILFNNLIFGDKNVYR